MEEENLGVETEVEEVTASPAEKDQPVEETESAVEEVPAEPVDDKGVPLKNRQAEVNRKMRKMSQSEAQSALVGQPTAQETTQDEAIRIVENIAEQRISRRLEPLLVKQFLLDNPDAKDMVEEINRVRASNPAIAGVDQLETAYKVAKAEMQDNIIRQRVEQETKQNIEKKTKAESASIEGVGRVRAPQTTLADKINSASSLDELKELEQSILG